jgi:preprotein translocase subunit SecG
MGFLSIILLVFFVLSALLLIGLVMIQEESSGGLGGIFGGGGASQVGNRSGNILTKTTSIIGAVFFLSSFGVAFLNRTPDTGNVEAAARRMEQGDAVPWWEVEEGDLDNEGELDDLMSPEFFEETPSN